MTDTPPETNRRKLAKARTMQKVRDAASALFEEHGYEDTHIRMIAKAAGMSTGAIFANWKCKAALYKDLHGHDPVTVSEGAALLAMVAMDHGMTPDEALARLRGDEPWA